YYWRVLIGAVAGLALFALPGFVRNWQAYHSILGPAEWVNEHHQGFDSIRGQVRKIYWNLLSSLAQNSAYTSQPAGIRAVSQRYALLLSEYVPEKDRYTYPGMDRRAALTRTLTLAEPDPDTAAFGVIPLVLFGVGSLAALTHHRKGGRLILIWSAGI